MKAWRLLADNRLPWKPDAVSIFIDDQDQIARHNWHSQRLAELVERVEARGGPRNPWTVNLAAGTATFGPLEVHFHRLLSGSTALDSYRRLDKAPDVDRDMADIEDAAYCIARTAEKMPRAAKALREIAEYCRRYREMTAYDLDKRPSEAEFERRQSVILKQADSLDRLAQSAGDGRATYAEFEVCLRELHVVGFFPEIKLISEVAHAMV